MSNGIIINIENVKINKATILVFYC